MSAATVKRITITLADGVFSELEDWAKQQGRPVANLAGFLVEMSLVQAKQDGSYKPSQDVPHTNR